MSMSAVGRCDRESRSRHQLHGSVGDVGFWGSRGPSHGREVRSVVESGAAIGRLENTGSRHAARAARAVHIRANSRRSPLSAFLGGGRAWREPCTPHVMCHRTAGVARRLQRPVSPDLHRASGHAEARIVLRELPCIFDCAGSLQISVGPANSVVGDRCLPDSRGISRWRSPRYLPVILEHTRLPFHRPGLASHPAREGACPATSSQ